MCWSLQKLSLSSNFPIWGKKLHFQRWEAAQKYYFLCNLHIYICIALFFLLTGLGTGGISVSPLFRSSMRDCQGAISFHPDFEIVTWFEMQLKAEEEQKTPRVHLHQAPPPLRQAHHLLLSLWFTILSLSFFLGSSFLSLTHRIILSSSSLVQREIARRISQIQPLPKCVELLSATLAKCLWKCFKSTIAFPCSNTSHCSLNTKATCEKKKTKGQLRKFLKVHRLNDSVWQC